MNGAAACGLEHTTTPLCDAERHRTRQSRRERVETVIRARGGAREATTARVRRCERRCFAREVRFGAVWCCACHG